jgi:hypothetical protein
VPLRIFPKLPEERNSLLFRAKGRGEGTLILNCLGIRKERLRVGGKEFPGSMHKGLLIIPAVQFDPAQREYCSP